MIRTSRTIPERLGLLRAFRGHPWFSRREATRGRKQKAERLTCRNIESVEIQRCRTEVELKTTNAKQSRVLFASLAELEVAVTHNLNFHRTTSANNKHISASLHLLMPVDFPFEQ
jgi:hypothetical protein